MTRRVLALVVLVVVGPAARPAQDSFPQLVVRELSAFDAGMSADSWLHAHPSDTLISFADSLTRDTQSWCARATAGYSLLDGRRATRIAYFFPPDPPADLALPTALAGVALQLQGCRLGGLWIDVPATPADTALAREVRSALTQTFGAEAPPPDSIFGRPIPERLRQHAVERGNDLRLFDGGLWGSASWRVVGVWRRDSVKTISAYDAERAAGGSRVLAFSMAGSRHFGADASGSAGRCYTASSRRRARSMVGNAARRCSPPT